MVAHEAGALHAEGRGRPPVWLREPQDVNALVPQLWPDSASKDEDGILHIGGCDVRALAQEHGTPAFLLDEADLRRRMASFRDGFDGFDVFYAGKAFLSIWLVKVLVEEGLNLDVCSGGELTVALRGGMPPARIGFHGNNKSEAELRRAVEAGVGRIIADSSEELERLSRLAQEYGVQVPVMLRVTAGVEAHTHEFIATAHEDQKFGFSLASGAALSAVRLALTLPGLSLLGLHSHIGSQIFDTSGFEVAARRVLRFIADLRREFGVELGELDLGGGFGIAYTTQDDPADPADLAEALRGIVAAECAALELAVPRLSIEPGRAIVGPAMVTLYEVGTTKAVELDDGASRRYVSVDGGMSDNLRTALYEADYSATVANRASEAPGVLSRVVGKHCESGDIVVKDEFLPADTRAGDLIAVPATGAYCKSMASNYNHILRPPVVVVGGGQSRVIIRRETEADLLATDLG